MSNREVFRAFAAGLEAEGANVASRRFGNALALYSYQTPIALRVEAQSGGHLTLWDSRTYSATTAKQQSQATAILGGAFRLPHEEFRGRCRAEGVDLTGAR